MQIATVSLVWMFLADNTIFEIYPLYKGENYKRTRKQFDVLIPIINFHFLPKGGEQNAYLRMDVSETHASNETDTQSACKAKPTHQRRASKI